MATLMGATVVGPRDRRGIALSLRQAEAGRLLCDGLTHDEIVYRQVQRPSWSGTIGGSPRVTLERLIDGASTRGLDDTVLSWRGASPIDDSPASLH